MYLILFSWRLARVPKHRMVKLQEISQHNNDSLSLSSPAPAALLMWPDQFLNKSWFVWDAAIFKNMYQPIAHKAFII